MASAEISKRACYMRCEVSLFQAGDAKQEPAGRMSDGHIFAEQWGWR